MTNKERYELHDWLAVNVIGWHEHDPRLNSFNPTSSGKDAMDVLKKCAENTWNVFIRKTSDGLWIVGYMATTTMELAVFAEAETLELAIAKFSKDLFSQTTK